VCGAATIRLHVLTHMTPANVILRTRCMQVLSLSSAQHTSLMLYRALLTPLAAGGQLLLADRALLSLKESHTKIDASATPITCSTPQPSTLTFTRTWTLSPCLGHPLRRHHMPNSAPWWSGACFRFSCALLNSVPPCTSQQYNRHGQRKTGTHADSDLSCCGALAPGIGANDACAQLWVAFAV